MVVDSETGQAIGGASIRVVGTTRGTYSRGDGTFRLPVDTGMKTLLVRSIGYGEITIAIAPSENLVVKLKSVGLTKRSVEVTADIQPEEVVRRAIARARENDERLKTLVSTTYSKMKVVMEVPDVGQEKQPKESITETFSRVHYQRHPSRAKRVHILQRRQTRNIPAANNLAVFDEFVDITQPEIRMFSTRLVTPLGEDALNTYTYRILERTVMGDGIVYQLHFEPTSRLFPGFEGTLSIVGNTYQVIAADFSPTKETAFPFITNLRYQQRYEQVSDSVWVPMYQNISGEGAVNLLADVMEFVLKLSIEAYVSEVQANVTIPDSVLHPRQDTSADAVTETSSGGVSIRVRTAGNTVTVAEDADSSRPEYWEKHAFAEQTEEEKEAYRVADSIVANRKPRTEDSSPRLGLFTIGPLGINVLPILTRTSITGWLLGGELEFVVRPVSLRTAVAWGEAGTMIGEVGADVDVVNSKQFDLTLFGNVFSTYATIQPPRPILGTPNFLNLNHLLYMEFNDYFRRDGWEAGARFSADIVEGTLIVGWTRHLADSVLKTSGRTVVRPDEGDYQTIRFAADVNRPNMLAQLFGSQQTVYGSLGVVVGRETSTNPTFATLDGRLGGRIPTFYTGYQPMHLDIEVYGAMVLSDSAPRQFQSSLLRRFPAIGTTTDLATVPVNRYGGNRTLVLHAEHNFSDLWWRAIGLPTFRGGRGLDLLLLYGAGVADGGQPIDAATWVHTSTPYMEAGFGIARIPSFVSDLIYLRFDALWPVGGLASSGTFGWSVTLSTSLF